MTKLSERIAELVPGIKKLEFGCQVQRYPYYVPETLVYLKSYKNGEQEASFIREDAISGTLTSREEIESWVILGRPIQLADVLRAINEAAPYGYSYRVDTDNWLHIEGEMGQRFWNLATDLDGQSPETKKFLCTLLGVIE